ncbi:MAG: hypothetical protein LBD33_00355 [Puniceicoccales bacterium]|jgi:23S rRNA-/tRNA-specific pseudouridylate synthase|nr:hypothetical protein [Puniceicoccales bacterium]
MSGQIYVRHPDHPNGSIELPIVHSDGRCIAAVKPVNLPCRVGKFSILNQVRANLQDSAVQALGIDYPGIVYDIECGLSGIFLLSKSKESMNILKNAYGSYLFELTFDLLCAESGSDKGQEIECSLPIAKHATEDRMIISAKTGKKSRTTFNFIEKFGKYEHWQAKCTYLRRDQICLHACEVGLAVLGDGKYGKAKIPAFDELKRNFKRNRKGNNELPYFGIMAHLSALKLPDGVRLRSELPQKILVFMRLVLNSWERKKF